jgi:hypothetical protein
MVWPGVQHDLQHLFVERLFLDVLRGVLHRIFDVGDHLRALFCIIIGMRIGGGDQQQ